MALATMFSDAGFSDAGFSGAERDPHVAFIDAIEALRIEHQIPGLSIAVVHDGELTIARGFGYADIEQGIAATADTPYDIASVAKPISGVAILRLVELGLIDLDRPIAEYSDWSNFCAAFRTQPSIFARQLQCDPPVHTLRHLLSHTGDAAVGTSFSYNPILFSWASRPVMAVASREFSDLVTELVFDKADMRDSARRHRARPLPQHLASRQAKPYRTDGGEGPRPAPERGAQGDGAAGGVVSTVVDLARFDLALEQGQLLSPAFVDQLMTPTPTQHAHAPYGIGFYIQEHAGLKLVWHSGWWEHAYSALYLKVPERSLTFIALANSEGIWWGNPLDEAAVERSAFARAFLQAFVTSEGSDALGR